MKYLTPIFVIALFFILSTPAIAGVPFDYIMNEQAEWGEICNDRGYMIVDSHIGVTCTNPREITYDLAPGTYHVYVSGGMYTRLMSMSAHSDIRAFGNDRDSTPYAAMSFILGEREAVTITLTPFMDATVFETDYYCLVLASEGDGGLHCCTVAPRPIEPPEPEEGEEPVEFVMDIDIPPADPDPRSTELRDLRGLWKDEIAGTGFIERNNDIFSVNEIPTKRFYYHYTGYTAYLNVAVDDRCVEMEVVVNDPEGNMIETQLLVPGEELQIIFPIEIVDYYTFDFNVIEYAVGFEECYVTYLVYLERPTE